MPRQFATDEHLDYVAALLDDMFRIPGTKIRFGLDALIGWVPGVGLPSRGSGVVVLMASAGAESSVELLEDVVGELAVGVADHRVGLEHRRGRPVAGR